MTEPLTTIYHAYRYDTREPADAAAWDELRARLKAQGLKCFHAIGDYCEPRLDGQTLTLETEHLFSNQWNTAPIKGVSELGLRVFDWAQDAIFINGHENRHTKRGHYLEQTPAMAEIRRNTVACGFCGAQERASNGHEFCPRCIDSEYLKDTELHLLRMLPVAGDPDRAPLTDTERAYLLPLYREAQWHGSTTRGKARIAKQRRDTAA